MKIDRNKIHNYFWENRDRFDRVRIHQGEVAEEFGITQTTMSHIMKEFTKEGRIKKIARSIKNISTYAIKDPAQFEHEFDPYKVPGFNIKRCKVCNELFQIGPHFPKILGKK